MFALSGSVTWWYGREGFQIWMELAQEARHQGIGSGGDEVIGDWRGWCWCWDNHRGGVQLPHSIIVVGDGVCMATEGATVCGWA